MIPGRGEGSSAAHKRYRRGLVVGKFCPLHRGHMHLIQTAIDTCGEVLVISYTKPEFAGMGRAVREAWLHEVFPGVRALVVDDASLGRLCASRGLPPRRLPHNDEHAAVHRAFTAWLCETICATTVDAVFTSEDYGDGFALALSAYFASRIPGFAPVRHVCVDLPRATVPVSGTRIRANPHRHRAFMHPAVYARFVQRICLLGGESSGKTTLGRALAERLDTVFVPEVGREHWEAHGGTLGYADMRLIAEGQVAREDALAREAREWLVCDGSALTTVFYSLDGFGRVDPAVRRLAARPYAFTFVCAPDFPFVQDGTRRDAGFRRRQHRWYCSVLAARGVPFVVLEGSLMQRLDTACRLLQAAVVG
jgi:HTH-type transcriptional repressor of NAD biosynthesis genes